MAISVTSRGFNYSDVTQSSIAITPTAGGAGNLYISVVMSLWGSVVSTLTGGGLTWTKLHEYNYNGGVSIWTATGTLTTATLTATFAGSTYDQFLGVMEVIGTTVIGQHVQGKQDSGGNSLVIDLNPFGSAGNRPFMAGVAYHDNTAQAYLTEKAGYVNWQGGSGGDSDGTGGYYGFTVESHTSSADNAPYLYNPVANNQYQTGIALELGPPVPTAQATFFASGNSSFSQSGDSNYSSARAGSNFAGGGNSDLPVGMDLSGFYEVWESFLEFNTAAIPDSSTIVSAGLSLYGMTDNSSTDFTVEVRAFDYGTFATTDFVGGDSLSGLTQVATLASSGFVVEGYNSFTSDAAFLTNISKTGLTRLVLSSDRHRIGYTPGGPENLDFYGSGSAPPAKPKLVVTYTVTDFEGWGVPIR